MARQWQIPYFNPPDFVKFMRLSVFDGFWIHQNLKIQSYPMRGFPFVFSENIPETQKLKIQNFRIIFFLNFLAQSLFHGMLNFQTAGTDIPMAVLVAGLLASFVHQKIPFAVMAKIDDADAHEIYPLTICLWQIGVGVKAFLHFRFRI